MSQALSTVEFQPARVISLFPSPVEWEMLKEQAKMLAASGFLPEAINTPEKAIAIALKGRELGIPPMQAFAHIHIIKGKPTISAELMLALIFRNCLGAVIDYLETTSLVCTIEAKRPGGKKARFSFSMDDAKKADLLGKDTWKKYPGAMLRARTIAIVARALFADAIMGCSHTPEEMGAEVDEDGEVISIPLEPLAPVAPSASNVAPKVISPKASSERTRVVIGIEIMEVAEKIQLGEAEMVEWIRNKFGTENLKSLSPPQMEEFLNELKKEIK